MTDAYYIPAADSLDIPFTMNATGLTPGNHLGNLHYTTNDYAHQTGDVAVLVLHTPELVFASEFFG